MEKCMFTGLPAQMCGHCSKTHALEHPAFHPQMQDDTPRFVKGRDSAKWTGLGRSTGCAGSMGARCAASEMSRRGTWSVKTTWGIEQILKTAFALRIPELSIVIPALVPKVGPLPEIRYDQAPARKTSNAVPNRFNYETMAHAHTKRNEIRSQWSKNVK